MTREERTQIKHIAGNIKGKGLFGMCFCTHESNGSKNFGIDFATPDYHCRTQNALNAKYFLQLLKNNDPNLKNIIWKWLT